MHMELQINSLYIQLLEYRELDKHISKQSDWKRAANLLLKNGKVYSLPCIKWVPQQSQKALTWNEEELINRNPLLSTPLASPKNSVPRSTCADYNTSSGSNPHKRTAKSNRKMKHSWLLSWPKREEEISGDSEYQNRKFSRESGVPVNGSEAGSRSGLGLHSVTRSWALTQRREVLSVTSGERRKASQFF